MIACGWQNLISKEEQNSKLYVKHVLWNFFQNSIKLLTILFLVVLQTFVNRRAHNGHYKGTPRSLQAHSKRIWALGHSKYLSQVLEWHLSTQALKMLRYLSTKTFRHWGTWALGHSKSTCALEHSKGTWTPRHSSTWALWHLRLSMNFI